jgi:hypothetical protein
MADQLMGGKIKGSWSEYAANGGVTGINVSDAGHEINIVRFNESSGTYRLVTSLSLCR